MNRNNIYRERRTPPPRAHACNMCQAHDKDTCEGTRRPSVPLAMAYVRNQSFDMLYEPREALGKGTLFSELYLPYCTGGTRR